MPVTADTSAPYTPFGQISEIMSRYREKGNPTVFNTETLGKLGIPDSLNARTLQALKVLDLVKEDGKPTDTFEAIHRAPSDKYQSVLQNWLRAAYADVFLYAEADDDETKIRDAFRNYNPSSQQGRMVSLFLGLCALAGLRQKSEKREASEKTRKKTIRTSVVQRPRKQQTVGDPVDTGLPPALTGLLRSLPNPSRGWTQPERDKFVNTFGTVLDFCYPIATAEQLKSDDAADSKDEQED